LKIVKNLAALAAAMFVISGCASFSSKPPPAPPPAIACGQQQPLEVLSLSFYPDPLPETRRVDSWRAMIRSDGTEICHIDLQVTEKDKDQSATLLYTVHLSAGTNRVLLIGADDYRVHGTELCYQVVAVIDGTAKPLPTKQTFCAKELDKDSWSMR
jgi:hypothetical protein